VATILASLTSTCRRHDIDAQLYLTQLLTSLSQARKSELPNWLPDQWKRLQAARRLRSTCTSQTAHGLSRLIRVALSNISLIWIGPVSERNGRSAGMAIVAAIGSIGFLRLSNLGMQRQRNCQQGAWRRIHRRDVSVVNAHGSSRNSQAKAQSTSMLVA
jgi:hypothetical protein